MAHNAFSKGSTERGVGFADGKNFIFFGNDRFKGEFEPFKNFNHAWLHQVHSCSIIKANLKEKIKADGHFTNKKDTALFIKTADCMPVFISGPDQILALHIGWRGLMKKFFTASRPFIKDPKESHIFIGPYIKYDSFQLDVDSTTSLLKNHNLSIPAAIKQELIRKSRTQKGHYYIDLKALLLREIGSAKFANITDINIDTFKSPVHYSHRRNRWRIGQNYSFILKIR